MSPIKEPHYFNTDIEHTWYIRDDDRYRALFSGAAGEQLVAEASTNYLRSAVAVPRIERELPGARYIVLVRNPVEMMPSLHDQLLWASLETEPDVEAAWRRTPTTDTERMHLDYRSLCMLGAQLERLLETTDPARVHVIVLDDLRSDPRAQWLGLLDFLEVPDDGRTQFPVLNAAKVRRWPWLRTAMLRVGSATKPVRRAIGLRGPSRVAAAMDARNSRERRREPIPEALRADLASSFRDDIALLGRLLERDLSAWTD